MFFIKNKFILLFFQQWIHVVELLFRLTFTHNILLAVVKGTTIKDMFFY